jgi:hypothetical protein
LIEIDDDISVNLLFMLLKLAIVNKGKPLTAEKIKSDAARLTTNMLGGVWMDLVLKKKSCARIVYKADVHRIVMRE